MPNKHSSGNPIINKNLPTQELDSSFLSNLYNVSNIDEPLSILVNTSVINKEVLLNGGIVYFELDDTQSDLVDNYEVNQLITPSQNSSNYGEIKICHSLWGDTKFTHKRIRLDGDKINVNVNAPGFVRRRMNLLSKRMININERLYFLAQSDIIRKTPFLLKWNNAGKHKNIALGSPSQPVILTKSNVLQQIELLSTALLSSPFVPRDMFLMIPSAIWSLIRYSNQRDLTNHIKINSGYKNRYQTNINGNPELVINDNLPASMIGNDVVYTCMAGQKKAFIGGWAQEEYRLVDARGADFAKEDQMLVKYGGGILNPYLYSIGYYVISKSALNGLPTTMI